ncbi:hypothetical protein BaRGS_00009752 [Batillaria attramentaria]|uniref:GH16 domain-containing protein n=1 Tax=Batillaria attramentaria TaxID=370345 RepID=A0ABD0LIF5_9CAEN
MLVLLAVVCLAGPLAASLPDVTVSHDGGLHFKMPDFPGVKKVFFNYMLETVENKVIPKVGHATLGGDGKWLWKDLEMVLHPGDKIQYNAVAYGPHGKVESPVKDWVYAPPPTTMGPRRTRAVVFRDDFNGAHVDKGNWNYEVSMYGGMNWEFQVYVPDESNVYTRNGHLWIKPTLTADDPRFNEGFLHNGVMDMQQIWGECTQSANYGCHREGKNGLLPPIMSGKIFSKPTLRYGTVEVRARIPRGDWIWPAIWMMPKDSHYGGWPRSGEIDIMESRGNMQHGVSQVSSTLHWGSSWDANHYSQTHGEKNSANWATGWHTWRLEWTPDHLTTFVDNQQIMRVDPGAGGFCRFGPVNPCPWSSGEKMAPFDQPFYMIFNVAVGGTNGFFPDGLWSNKPWSNNSPHAADDFYAHKNEWYSTWHGDDVAMWIDWVEFRSL